jgi:hypothetical protein
MLYLDQRILTHLRKGISNKPSRIMEEIRKKLEILI